MENSWEEEGQRLAAARVVHSQVRKIKEEEGDKVKVDETYQQQQQLAGMRLVLRDLGRQRSRSPLGRVGRPAISISIGGDS
ncbi:hypothetical protein D1007_51747 [Hordeum vulgare]|uniref:Predicted protein n=1 Tax=Hordeum vulgare subsp. vulgare TaxID=112509 RepID=F2CSN9_HORVV|nr:uncharacterized protein LOC123403136 [Hordeum vulgare subsp. vulgare]KAE8775741.1 hypothetical protein D1007_51747 [Hordeum vulgare]KAI4967955.1 hypothetical protein ZWY2020_008671 [Hordeum vulgare]KAI4981787.1 hypothetical protein ZWY2020_022279 [Hordeum vulgare]BAJ85860.1 predicted protein [Hordeum vulgare subsp. vulgare]